MDPQAAPAQDGASGGLSQKVADVNSGLLSIMDAVQAKYPETAQKLQSVIQGYQSVIEDLGQPEGAPDAPSGVATTTPEAGAAKVQPAM